MSAKYPSTKDCRLPWCVLAALLLGFIPTGLWAQGLDACGPAPAVKAAIEQAHSYTSPLQADWQMSEHSKSALQALFQEYPDDVFVLRAYFGSLGSDEAIKQLKARHAQDPDNPKWAYLYGETLVGHDTPQAIKLFESALAKAPQFPWPHLSLVRIYTSPNFLHKDLAATHMRAFLGLCPESVEGYRQLTGFDDEEMLRQDAVKLRALLQSRSDPDVLGAYSMLWRLEFKTHPASEHDALRKQVGEDLQRLRALNLQDKQQWYQALEAGYNLVNDQKQSDWAKEERVRRFPTPWELPARDKWFAEHMHPSDDAPADKQREYYTELVKQSAEWVKERPYTTFIWVERAEAMEHLEDVPAVELEAAVDKALQVAKSNAGPQDLNSYSNLFTDYFSLADVLSKRGLQPEREVQMAQKGLVRLESYFEPQRSDLYATKEQTEMVNFDYTGWATRGLRLEADGYLRLKQAEKAQIVLAQLDERLQDLRALAGDKQDRKQDCLARESRYWGLMGRLAELQNRKLDAMAYYENGLLKRLEAKQKPESGVKDELVDNARPLWKSLGGTDEGWRVWYGYQADALFQQAITWQEASLPLPSFQLTDLHGKTWQVADLKGKVTLLTFWAVG